MKAAEDFVSEEKEVPTPQDALGGAMDIIAEMLSDSAAIRAHLRPIFRKNALLKSTATDEEQDSVYTNYYDYSEAVKKIAGHRILAVNRGEKEGFLKVGIVLEPSLALNVIYHALDKGTNPL